MRGHVGVQEAEGIDGAIARVDGAYVLALRADTERGQPEAGGGEAGRRPRVGCRPDVEPVSDQPRERIRLLPEVEEGRPLDFIEQAVVFRRQRVRFAGPARRRLHPLAVGVGAILIPLWLLLRRRGAATCHQRGQGNAEAGGRDSGEHLAARNGWGTQKPSCDLFTMTSVR